MPAAEPQTFLIKQHTQLLSEKGGLHRLRGTGKVEGRCRVFLGGMFCRPECAEGWGLVVGAGPAAGLGGRTVVRVVPSRCVTVGESDTLWSFLSSFVG